MRCPTLNEGYLETSTTLRIRNLDTDKGQEKSLDGTYRKMLRMVLGISWKVSNVTLYGNLYIKAVKQVTTLSNRFTVCQ